MQKATQNTSLFSSVRTFAPFHLWSPELPGTQYSESTTETVSQLPLLKSETFQVPKARYWTHTYERVPVEET